jgi:hypothetical protein
MHCPSPWLRGRRQVVTALSTMPGNVISDTTIRDIKMKRVTNNLSVTWVHETRHRLVVVHAPGARCVTNNDVFVTRVNKTRHR